MASLYLLPASVSPRNGAGCTQWSRRPGHASWVPVHGAGPRRRHRGETGDPTQLAAAGTAEGVPAVDSRPGAASMSSALRSLRACSDPATPSGDNCPSGPPSMRAYLASSLSAAAAAAAAEVAAPGVGVHPWPASPASGRPRAIRGTRGVVETDWACALPEPRPLGLRRGGAGRGAERGAPGSSLGRAARANQSRAATAEGDHVAFSALACPVCVAPVAISPGSL